MAEEDYAAFAAFPKTRRTPRGGFDVPCPCGDAHQRGDIRWSGRIWEHDGGLRWHCYKGCSWRTVMKWTNTKPSHWFRGGKKMSGSRVIERYDYLALDGTLLYQVCRTEPKGFFQRRPDGKGGWINNVADVDLVLYNQASIGEYDTVAIVEGERKVNMIRSLGWAAVSSSGGAGKWKLRYGERLRGKDVVIFPDNNDVGRSHAMMIAGSAVMGGCSGVAIVDLDGLEPNEDIGDWLKRIPPLSWRAEIEEQISKAKSYRH